MRKSISTILIYNGKAEFLEPALLSVTIQTRKSDQLFLVDACPNGSLAELLGKLPFEGLQIESRLINSGIEESDYELLNRIASKSKGEYLFFVPDHHVIAPTFLESTAGLLDQNSSLSAVCTSARVFGDENALVTFTLPEVFVFPERPCFGVYRREAFDGQGGFGQLHSNFMHADLLLRIVAKDVGAVTFCDQPLFLARYANDLLQPSLHKIEPSQERAEFLKRHKEILVQHGPDVISLLEQQHFRQQQSLHEEIRDFQLALTSVQAQFEDSREKYNALSKFHIEAMSSVRCTFEHLLAALKRKLLSAK